MITVFIDCLWEFHQIYNFGAVGDKDEPVWLWGQKINGYSETKYVLNNQFGRYFLTCLWNSYSSIYFSET